MGSMGLLNSQERYQGLALVYQCRIRRVFLNPTQTAPAACRETAPTARPYARYAPSNYSCRR